MDNVIEGQIRLVEADELFSMIQDLFKEATGIAWEYRVARKLELLVEDYNDRGKDYLLDVLLEGFVGCELEVINIADRIVDYFSSIIDHHAIAGYGVVIEYVHKYGVLKFAYEKIRSMETNHLHELAQRYRHERENNDYHPESYRRLIEELVAYS